MEHSFLFFLLCYGIGHMHEFEEDAESQRNIYNSAIKTLEEIHEKFDLPKL